MDKEDPMYQMVMLVMEELEKASQVINAWERVGVSGITIMESTGVGRTRAEMAIRDDIPMMPSLTQLLQTREEEHRTIFTLADSDAMVDALIDATQEITGDLDGPNKGILFVVPVLRAVGVMPGRTPNDADDRAEGDGA